MHPDFLVAITEESIQNGHRIQRDQAVEMLELNKPYEVELIMVGDYNVALKLKNPNYTFNAELFKKVELEESDLLSLSSLSTQKKAKKLQAEKAMETGKNIKPLIPSISSFTPTA